ncbi:hypothetical protein [Kribbella sp. NPDC004536]|uniref:hypothetical protein n=1 Tax=Kribbella sp. NPDC004536 TaxID=3364106 RepID=UPI0036A1DF78
MDELLQTPGALEEADTAQLLAALTALHELRAYFDHWEPILIDAARDRGATWADIAPTLGVASRQAAERRYLRLKPHAGDQPGITRESRVQAARDRRAGDRAVAGWARDNAAALRELAGQVTAVSGDPSTSARSDADIAGIRDALGGDDASDLVEPLTAAGPGLRAGHPDLADRIARLTETTDTIRTRRTPPK